MTTKQAVPNPLPLPQDVPTQDLEERTLRFAANSLLEHLSAKENDVDDVAVQASVFNLQNLMRLFDRPVYVCPIEDGSVRFDRRIEQGDWEEGRWKLAWEVRDDTA